MYLNRTKNAISNFYREHTTIALIIVAILLIIILVFYRGFTLLMIAISVATATGWVMDQLLRNSPIDNNEKLLIGGLIGGITGFSFGYVFDKHIL